VYSRLEKAAVPAGGPTTTLQLGLEDRGVVAIDASVAAVNVEPGASAGVVTIAAHARILSISSDGEQTVRFSANAGV